MKKAKYKVWYDGIFTNYGLLEEDDYEGETSETAMLVEDGETFFATKTAAIKAVKNYFRERINELKESLKNIK